MSEEFDELLRNDTWDLVPKSNQNLVGCKWVFCIKRNPDGTIAKYKACLVARGFHPCPRLDDVDTFSPITKSTTIRVVFCLALSQGWPFRQLDINNALLHGTLHNNVYMVQPPTFIHSSLPHHVCKLRKALYGLKQAPRAWCQELKGYLFQSGFTNSVSNASLFIYTKGDTISYFLVYVDNIINW